MLEKGVRLKTTAPVNLLSVVSRVFEKLVNNRLANMTLGLLDQLQIFRQLYLIELL